MHNAIKVKLLSREKTSSPSFDCTKASTQTEHDICYSDKVSALDLKLGNTYLKIKNDMPLDDFNSLIEIQKEWVKDRDNKCSVQNTFEQREKCLIEVYKKRLDAFGLLSVINTKVDYVDLFSPIYDHGTSEERFELAAYLYYSDKKI